ncbi:NAC domain-containing protein 62 [Vigna angularis]|uniref:NAC domain-containing protein 62 n=1 Tax=Phaseolus angularis TaxID=3914 RepID=UPI0022B467E9|nr:NAC domain-containing protein 62 [Vigna angularis]
MDVIGFGFRPTEEELVDYYLRHRLLGDDPQVHVIPDIDLCEVEPWDVPMLFGESDVQFDFREWFFFSPVGFKYSNTKRINRTTKCGFWKPTGKDREIRSSDSNILIATKKTLVYYKGRVSRAEKSNWVIHEYHAVTFHESQRTFVLCRLMKKPGGTTAGGGDDGESSGIMVSGYENQSIAGGIPSRSTFSGMGTTLQQDETSFPNSSYHDAYFRNESNIEHISYETTQEEEFLNNIFVHDGYVNNEQNINTFYNTFTPSESLRKVYHKNNDTDAEVVYEQGDNIMNISTVFNRYLNLDEYHSSKGFDSELSDVDIKEDVGMPSSVHETNQEKKKKKKKSIFSFF